jgi:hypothetical protein
MNEHIKNLKEKHKDFIKKIEVELLKENDDYGNAKRLEIYLNAFKEKKVKDKKEKIIILQEMASDYEAEVAYNEYLEQLDSPRQYLEKTFPTFYRHFKIRFDKFIGDWLKTIGEEKFSDSFTKDLFVFYCRLVQSEIESEINYINAINYVEKNGLPTVKPGRKNMTYETFIAVVDTLFELPDMIIASFDLRSQVFKESQIQFQEKQRGSNLTPGNYIEFRKSGSYLRYKMVAKLIKIFDTKFKHIHGTQEKACQIAESNPTSFSKWLNSKSKDRNGKTNFDKYLFWQSDIPESEHSQLKELIDNFLK